MRHNLFLALFLFGFSQMQAQTTITFDDDSQNKMYIKLYAHVDYNQKIDGAARTPGKMDVHRLVTLFGYQFNRKTQFVSEIEVEHVKEIFIEQAFVKHRLTKSMSLRAGLLLIPMGFVNEAHEPTFFYTVERPLLDKNIIPSTWREIGFGISGLIPTHSLKYQLYLVNNPLGYDGSAKINAEKGFRSARQKGAESLVSTLPGLSGQLEYYGLDNFKVGLSLYHGKTNTSLVNDFKDDLRPEVSEIIDSSTVNMSMATIHSSFARGPFTARAQYTLASYANTVEYNSYTGSDVPELMHGYYLLFAYDLLKEEKLSLEPFLRVEHLNNQLRISDNMVEDASLKQNIYSFGINYKPDPGVVFKIDYQIFDLKEGNDFQQFNAGIGVWF